MGKRKGSKGRRVGKRDKVPLRRYEKIVEGEEEQDRQAETQRRRRQTFTQTKSPI